MFMFHKAILRKKSIYNYSALIMCDVSLRYTKEEDIIPTSMKGGSYNYMLGLISQTPAYCTVGQTLISRVHD